MVSSSAVGAGTTSSRWGCRFAEDHALLRTREPIGGERHSDGKPARDDDLGLERLSQGEEDRVGRAARDITLDYLSEVLR